MSRKRDLLRNQERPEVLGYALDPETLTPKRSIVNVRAAGKDHGADPIGDGTFAWSPRETWSRSKSETGVSRGSAE